MACRSNGRMPSVEQTKARLMHGVVQDNINLLRNVRVTAIQRRGTRHWLWIVGGVVAAGTVYSAMMFLSLVPTAKAPAASDVSARQDVSTLNIEHIPELKIALSTPRPIDRAAIPLSIKTIVIDAGHGGEPGTTAESGITEKEITLDLALRLRRLLKDAPFKVLLTRETDRDVARETRQFRE